MIARSKVLLPLLAVLATAPAASGAEPEAIELRTEIFDSSGASMVRPVMRLRIGEPSTVSIQRNGVTVALTATVNRSERALCHKISIGLSQTDKAQTKRIDTSAITCGEQTVKIQYAGPSISLQVVAAT